MKKNRINVLLCLMFLCTCVILNIKTADAASTYTISYNGNGGINVPLSQIKTHGVGIVLSTTQPIRNGYIFLGWSTDNNAAAADYQPGDIFNINAKTTLYAVWEKVTYEISYYDMVGGKASLVAVQKNLSYEDKISIANIGSGKAGYTLKGWSTANDDKIIEYTPGENIQITKSLTLYAVWELNTYLIKYHANGGENPPNVQTKTYGVSIKLSTEKPTRNGYTFLGWSSGQNASVPTYQAGAGFSENSNITLYAVWKKNENSMGNRPPLVDKNNIGISKTTYILSKPKSVKIKKVTGNKVKLSWKSVKNAQQYKISSSKKKSKGYQYIGKTKSTSYTISGLSYAVKYYYKVEPIRTSGSYKTTSSSPVSVKMSGKPVKPVINSLKKVSNYYKLTFTTKKDASHYEIMINNAKTSLNLNKKNAKTVIKFGNGTYANKKNKLKIRLYNVVKKKKVYSSWSKTIRF